MWEYPSVLSSHLTLGILDKPIPEESFHSPWVYLMRSSDEQQLLHLKNLLYLDITENPRQIHCGVQRNREAKSRLSYN
jgi:hypothetical protein